MLLHPFKGAGKSATRDEPRPPVEDLTAYEQTPFGWRKKRSRKVKVGLTIATAAAAAAGAWFLL